MKPLVAVSEFHKFVKGLGIRSRYKDYKILAVVLIT